MRIWGHLCVQGSVADQSLYCGDDRDCVTYGNDVTVYILAHDATAAQSRNHREARRQNLVEDPGGSFGNRR